MGNSVIKNVLIANMMIQQRNTVIGKEYVLVHVKRDFMEICARISV